MHSPADAVIHPYCALEEQKFVTKLSQKRTTEFFHHHRASRLLLYTLCYIRYYTGPLHPKKHNKLTMTWITEILSENCGVFVPSRNSISKSSSRICALEEQKFVTKLSQKRTTEFFHHHRASRLLLYTLCYIRYYTGPLHPKKHNKLTMTWITEILSENCGVFVPSRNSTSKSSSRICLCND